MPAPQTPPSLDAQVNALAIAFTELAKMLGREQLLSVTQLATALENEASRAKASGQMQAAVLELARRLR